MSRLAPHAEDPRGARDDAPAADADVYKSMFKRRSSMPFAPPADAETPSPAKPSVLVAGDQLARPHFLKDRSMTMHDRIGSTSLSATVTNHQSKASMFLTRLLEASRSASPTCDGKSVPAPNQQATASPSINVTTAASPASRPQGETSDIPLIPQRRRQSVVVGEPHIAHGNHLQHLNTTPALLPATRLRNQSVGSGGACLTTHEEDEQDEYITEIELQARPLTQLVQDLSLYNKRSGTLLRILKEIVRRLRDADGESNAERPSHIALCEDLVDGGILAGVLLVLREFRFHVALQSAALALLSFIADVSDLYAYMMAELDAEPLVQKIAAVHVSQERLVMNASSLIHTISESKHKSHVRKMLKARQIEREKKRAASFVEAFVAERKNSMARVLEGSVRRYATPVLRDNLHSREPSPWQRRELGVPPALTAHYDLKISLLRPRSCLIPPLEKTEGDDDKEMLFRSHGRRPATSPDPRQPTGQSSVAKLAAVYLSSPTFVAPSPMRQRLKAVRSTRSAVASTQKMITRRGRSGVLAMRDSCGSLEPTTTDHECSASSMFNTCMKASHDERGTCDQASSQQDVDGRSEAKQTNGCDESEDDAKEDIVGLAAEENGDDNNEGSQLTLSDRDRLLPVGSDSDLFDLVDLSPPDDRSPPDLEVYKCIKDIGSSRRKDVEAQVICREQMCSDDACVLNAKSPRSSMLVSDDASELVSLLGGCVNPEDPIDGPKDVEDSRVRATKSAKARLQKTESSPSLALWTSPNPIIRPVSKRILDKAAKTSRRQRRSSFSSEKTCKLLLDEEAVQATAQATSTLDKSGHPPVFHFFYTDAAQDSASTKRAEGFLYSPPPLKTPNRSVAGVQALYARGLQHQKANELDAAVRCYEEGIHMQHSCGVQREFASLYINLGSARMAQQRPYDALVAFTQAERIQPSNLKAKFNCGLVLMQLAQWKEAATKFAQVVAADPSHVRAQIGLEQCREAVKQI